MWYKWQPHSCKTTGRATLIPCFTLTSWIPQWTVIALTDSYLQLTLAQKHTAHYSHYFREIVHILKLRCIKDWMNTKNTFRIISLEIKMIWVSDVISDHLSTGHTHCPTQNHAHMLYIRLPLPCVPKFSEGVADLQKERTCKRYIDEWTTAHAAMNGRSEDWKCNNTE